MRKMPKEHETGKYSSSSLVYEKILQGIQTTQGFSVKVEHLIKASYFLTSGQIFFRLSHLLNKKHDFI